MAALMATLEGLEMAGPARLPTRIGDFEVYAFRHPELPGEHAAIVKGDVRGGEVLCRVHSACLTGDVFHSLRCDCGAQFDTALARIEEEGRGVVVYLNQEGRGIGFLNKIRAYVLQDGGRDTVEANQELGLPTDARDYTPAADVLRVLEVESVRLLTNNPAKVQALGAAGLRVEERVPLHVDVEAPADSYLDTKRDRLGHLLPRRGDPGEE